jgi:hypothetical protein
MVISESGVSCYRAEVKISAMGIDCVLDVDALMLRLTFVDGAECLLLDDVEIIRGVNLSRISTNSTVVETRADALHSREALVYKEFIVSLILLCRDCNVNAQALFP